jgi:hypothetical protein
MLFVLSLLLLLLLLLLLSDLQLMPKAPPLLLLRSVGRLSLRLTDADADADSIGEGSLDRD